MKLWIKLLLLLGIPTLIPAFTPDNTWRANQIYSATHLFDIEAKGCSSNERNALIDFYYSMNGEAWLNNGNWLVDDPCLNNWFGVMCNIEGQIIGLHFFRNRMNGVFPDTIHNLANLRILHFFNDALDGKDDQNILYLFDLTLVEDLVISHVGMKGLFPKNVEKLTKLEQFNLAYNQISGPITTNFGLLPSLKILQLSSNNLNGPLPASLNQAIKLETIELFSNSLTGNIPVFSMLPNLQYFDLRENKLSGSLPLDYFSQSQFLNLEYMGITHNANLLIPQHCIRLPFCYKRTFVNEKIGNVVLSLESKTKDYIDTGELYEDTTIDNF